MELNFMLQNTEPKATLQKRLNAFYLDIFYSQWREICIFMYIQFLLFYKRMGRI